MECALLIVHLSGHKAQNLEGCNRTDAMSFKLPLSMKVNGSDKKYQTLSGKLRSGSQYFTTSARL